MKDLLEKYKMFQTPKLANEIFMERHEGNLTLI